MTTTLQKREIDSGGIKRAHIYNSSKGADALLSTHYATLYTDNRLAVGLKATLAWVETPNEQNLQAVQAALSRGQVWAAVADAWDEHTSSKASKSPAAETLLKEIAALTTVTVAWLVSAVMSDNDDATMACLRASELARSEIELGQTAIKAARPAPQNSNDGPAQGTAPAQTTAVPEQSKLPGGDGLAG